MDLATRRTSSCSEFDEFPISPHQNVPASRYPPVEKTWCAGKFPISCWMIFPAINGYQHAEFIPYHDIISPSMIILIQ
jgi:hypothetical protein